MNGKIYQLTYEGTPFYIGSTTKTLQQRKSGHRQDFNKQNSPKRYEIVAHWDGVQIQLLEEVVCDTKEELYKKEKEYILEHRPIGNKNIPLRTNKEWINDNRERRNLYMKLYMREYYKRCKATSPLS